MPIAAVVFAYLLLSVVLTLILAAVGIVIMAFVFAWLGFAIGIHFAAFILWAQVAHWLPAQLEFIASVGIVVSIGAIWYGIHHRAFAYTGVATSFRSHSGFDPRL